MMVQEERGHSQVQKTRSVVIEARELRKEYGAFVAVSGIHFSVFAQECFGFLGPNGAGKTSTMKMIYGGCTVTSGTLHILGMNFQQQSRQIKQRLGVVPQDINLDEDLSVLENLLVYARYFDLLGKEAHSRVESSLEQMQLLEKKDQKVDTLSGGMKRRLLIARALVANPDILVLDEPTVGLDPQARHLLWEILRDLREAGLTLLLSTHYMDEAEKLCDRLVVMDKGAIIAEGSPKDLIERYVGGEVLELERERGQDEEVSQRWSGDIFRAERVGRRLLLYCRDAEGLLRSLREAEVLMSSATLRRATLEDVFLTLTGRELMDE